MTIMAVNSPTITVTMVEELTSGPCSQTLMNLRRRLGWRMWTRERVVPRVAGERNVGPPVLRLTHLVLHAKTWKHCVRGRGGVVGRALEGRS
jgi:hypothetical protein